MAKAIKRQEVIEDGIFDNFIKGAKASIVAMEQIESQFKQSLEAQRQFMQGWKAFDSKSIRDLNAAMKDSASIIKQMEQLKKQQAQTEEALNKVLVANEKLERERIKTQRVKVQDDEKAAKATARKAEQERKLNSVYEQSKKRLNEIKRDLKELEIQEKGNSKVAKSLREEYEKLNEKIRKAEASVGEFQRNVGNYPSVLGKAEKAARSFGNQILNIAGVAGGVMFFQDAIEQIGKFDQALADLRAITGLTAKDDSFKFLRDQALLLGQTTTTSAVDVIEAYKLIASAQPELLKNADALNKVTKAAITLSEASGMELPAAATALTDAMNQFGASSAEAQRYIDVLANGAKYGSAEIQEITDALLKFGVAAKNSNVSVEESTAVIEAFAEKGLKGAEAGTAFRNILLKLSAAKALPKEALNQLDQAGVDIEKLSDSSLTLNERLAELSKIEGNSVAITKVFGIENAVAAETLLLQRDRVAELTGQMGEYGTAATQAKERTDTVEGELKKLANTWQALIIKFGEGGGSLKSTIKFIRENLETIVEVVINVTQAFLAYKAAVMAVNVAYKTKDAVNYIMNLVKIRSSVKAVAAATKEQEAAQLAANRAMKANVIGFVVSGLITLVDQLDLFKSSADLAAESQERINSALNNAVTSIDEIEGKYRQNISLLEQEYDLNIRQAKLNGANAEQIKKLEQEKKKAIEKGSIQAYKDLDYMLEQSIIGLQQMEAKAKEIGDLADSRNSLIKTGLGIDGNGSLNEQIITQKKFIENLKERQKLEKLEFFEKKIAEKEAVKEQENLTKQQADALKKAREDEYNALLKEFEKEKTLEETALLRTTESEESKASKKLGIEQNFLEKKLSIDKQYAKEWEKTEQELVLKKIQIEQSEIERKRKLQEKLSEIQALIDEQEIRNTENQFERERLQALREFELKIAQLEKEGKLTQELEVAMKKELVKKLSEIEESESASNLEDDKKNYEDYYKWRENQILNEAKTEDEADKKLLELHKERLKDEIELLDEYGQDSTEKRNELRRLELDEERDHAEKRKQIIKDFSTRAIEIYEERLQKQRELEESQIENEIDKRKSSIDRQRELAEKGLDNTLVYEEQKLEQAELKKEQLKKKAISDEKKITFLKLLQGYATEGKASEAVKRALTDIALAQVIGGAFFEGTELVSRDATKTLSTGKDDYVVRVHGTERVVDGKNNSKMGGLSNDELAEIARMYNHGELVPRYAMPTVQFYGKQNELHYSGQLVNEVKQLQSGIREVHKAIKDRPVVQHGFNEYLEYVETRIYDNKIERIRHHRSRPRI